jgi:hypothetical protein
LSIYYRADEPKLSIEFYIPTGDNKVLILDSITDIMTECRLTRIYNSSNCWTYLESSPIFNKEDPSVNLFDENEFQKFVNITAKEAMEIINCIMSYEKDIMEALE